MLSEFAPAKVNLFLSVIRKRNDGYHDIGSMFHTVSCGDMLFCEKNTNCEISISYNTPQNYPPEEDLVYKATLKIKEEFDVPSGVNIHLEKYLPLGAGLGGGSSDAAAALRALDRLWGLNASTMELEQIGASLGADVPFFIRGGAALGEDRGEILTPLKPMGYESCVIVIATPKCSVSTVEAYKDIVPIGKQRWQNFVTGLKNGEFSSPLDDSYDFFNHFEASIFEKYPLIASLKQKLNACGGKSLLAGSGSSVFSIFSSLAEAVKAYDFVKDECRFLRIAKFYP